MTVQKVPVTEYRLDKKKYALNKNKIRCIEPRQKIGFGLQGR